MIGREVLSGVDSEVCPTEEIQFALEFAKPTLDDSAQLLLSYNITKLPCDTTKTIPATVELCFTSDDGSQMKERGLAGRWRKSRSCRAKSAKGGGGRQVAARAGVTELWKGKVLIHESRK